MSLSTISQDLITAEKTLAHWSVEYPKVAKAEADASIAFELAWSQALQLIDAREVPDGKKKPTVGIQEAEATVMCSKELTNKKLTAVDLDVAKKLISIAETTLTSIQTRVKIEQMDLALSGTRI